MRFFTRVERDILWYLTKRGNLSAGVSIKSVRRLTSEYDLKDIEEAWENLKDDGLVQGSIGGGNISGATVYKDLKDHFRYRMPTHFISTKLVKLKNIGKKHIGKIILTIILGLIVAYLAGILGI